MPARKIDYLWLFEAAAHGHVEEEGCNADVFALKGPDVKTFTLEGGSFFGLVVKGTAQLVSGGPEGFYVAGQWFAVADRLVVNVLEDAEVLVIAFQDFRVLPQSGGPLEAKGRLRYIDGCSDTLLVGPSRQGDPCLNHLHFPAGIEQTYHTHPSARIGVVVRGAGWCHSQEGIRSPLTPGKFFVIPKDTVHRFSTAEQSLDVVAFHPDSDWGPTDEIHPMINRTWVDGAKLDNTGEKHHAQIITGK